MNTPDREPDGYAIIQWSKNAPKGYWFVGAWQRRETAEGVHAMRNKTVNDEALVPVWIGEPIVKNPDQLELDVGVKLTPC